MRTRRTIVPLMIGVLVAGGLVATGEPPSSNRDGPAWLYDGTGPATAQEPDKIKAARWQPSTSAPLGASTSTAAASATFPVAAKWQVRLGATGTAADVAVEDVRRLRLKSAADLPVQVSAGTGAKAGTAITMEVLDRAAAERAGVTGFVFKMAPSGDTKLTVSIDYSKFAGAYGAGFADRLGVVALAECAVREEIPADCDRTPKRLATKPDTSAAKLVADVTTDDRTVFAVTSALGGDEGTFAATQLSPSGTWQVSPGSGSFSYAYPIDLPAPAGGTAPTVSLNYSSAAVDGLTLASNTQAGATGLGWSDFANGFIERQYEPCFREPVRTSDLCWKSDNATISLAGIAGPLLPVNSDRTEWRVQSDPGWRIQRLTNAPYTTVYQGQHWKVTGPDGTQYFFGFGHMPGSTTNSILAVPVLGDNPGEPCWGGTGPGGCDQAWRWYLDRVIDPDGNVQSYVYEREDNWYLTIGGLGGKRSYHRGALLKEIWYGGRDWDAESYSARVTFGHQWRCNALNADCPAPNRSNGTLFPDVPNDLTCGEQSACPVKAPSFFVGRRYSHVRSDVRVGGAWLPVTQHNLYHSFGDGQNGVAKKLQLESIQRAGIAFRKLAADPSTVFGYAYFDNRADHDGLIAKAMRHRRLNAITNPFGGRIEVTYGKNRACDRTYTAWPRWDLNVRDCFPQSIKDDVFLRTGVFNKLLVMQVAEMAARELPAVVTRYAYGEDPAWTFDTGSFSRDDDETGWSTWAGYGTTTVTKGTSTTRLRMFRGLDQDPQLVQDSAGNWVPLGRRTALVPAFDGSATFTDHRSLAGRTLEEQSLGSTGNVLESRRFAYERRITHDPGPSFLFDAEWVGQTVTTESVATAPGVFRQRRSQTTYNATFQPTSTLEEGWLDRTGDERCSITTYADNPAAGMTVYPAVNRKVAGNCASTQVLSLSETYYDGSLTLGAPPTRGNPTRVRTLIETGRWSETTTEYDTFGRPVKTTDPTGAVTTTDYSASATPRSSHAPTKTTVTNPLGQQSITEWHPEFGVPKRVQDANGNVTTYGYDAFGRTETVWAPTEPESATLEPTIRYAYDLGNRAVHSRRLASESRTPGTAVFDDTWVIYDGFWRESQIQSRSPVAGRVLVSQTSLDERGLLREETVEQAHLGTPGRRLPVTAWQNRTVRRYDELGREVERQWLRGDTVAHTTRIAYGVDEVTVTGPDGRRVRQRIDGLGRTIGVDEHDGQGWVTASYGYDLADRLVSMTDPDGVQIRYQYNLAGWRIGQQDPNRGTATFGYDNAGRQTSVVDPLGNQIHTRFDPLGRQIERRAGSPTGQLLNSWQYDAAPGGKGMPHRELVHTAGGNWVSETIGYDAKGRATGTRLTVPIGMGALAGTYQVSQTYDRADRIRSVTYPTLGGLPQETVTTDYNTLGLPTRMAGLEEYVWGVTYDDRGRRLSAGSGPRPGGSTWFARHWSYNADQRLAGVETYIAGTAGVVADHDLTFDAAGNVTGDLVRQGSQTWRECYGYDGRSRLTAAHTVAATATCAAGQPGTGDQPYRQTYRYSPGGRLLERGENGVSTAYSYTGARPHAPTQIGADRYTWDGRGNLATRTVAGATETFSWDVQGMLRSVTGPGGTSEFLYDAGGQRLLRRTPDGRATLYVAGHEVTAAGSTVTAVRPYTFDGHLVATRTPSRVEYLVTGPTGSVEQAVPSGGQPSATRSYAPYGQVRTQTGQPATDRGFLGQIEDRASRLSYLNARYYDAATGVFVSTDPVIDSAKIKTLNPYSYAGTNPTSFTDPSGMYSSYAWGLEVENAKLKEQNKALIAQIGMLVNHIEDLQDIIKKQQKQISKLLSYIEALEAEIARQASIIRQLQARIAYLERVVAAQAREISRLRAVVARQQQIIRYQAGVIRYQAGVIKYQRGVITQLVNHAFLPGYRAPVLESIFSGNGIPSWNGSAVNYWKGVAAAQQTKILGLQGSIAKYSVGLSMAQFEYEQLEADYEITSETVAMANDQIAALNDEIDDMLVAQAAQNQWSWNKAFKLLACQIPGPSTICFIEESWNLAT